MKPFSWIKLSTEFFEDPKILRLQTYPEKDFLLIFWIKLVLLSLRRNDGLLLIDDTLPYSVSDFVSLFRKEENVVRMALSIFEKLKMIEVNPSEGGEIIGIREFVGFSDVEELDDARRKNREKQAAFRKRQKSALLAIRESKNEDSSEDPKDVTGYSPVTNQNFEVSNQKVTEQNKNREEEEKEGDITPTPTPPPKMGRREFGTNSRNLGTNPRANETNPLATDTNPKSNDSFADRQAAPPDAKRDTSPSDSEKSRPNEIPREADPGSAKGDGSQSRQKTREADPGSAKGDGSQSRQNTREADPGSAKGGGSQSRQNTREADPGSAKGDGSQSRQNTREADPGSAKGDGSQSRQSPEESRPGRDKKHSEEPIKIPSWLNSKDWNDFLSFRESIRAPMTDIAKVRAIEELDRLRAEGHDPSRVIGQSIVNGWKGLFPVNRSKDSQGQGSPQKTKTFDEIRREKNRQAFEAFLAAHKKEESNVVDAK